MTPPQAGGVFKNHNKKSVSKDLYLLYKDINQKTSGRKVLKPTPSDIDERRLIF
jgi:hypothetical protein